MILRRHAHKTQLMKTSITLLIAVVWFGTNAFAQSTPRMLEAGPILSTATIAPVAAVYDGKDSGLNLGYGARIGLNVGRSIGFEAYVAKHPLASFESSPGTIVDRRSSLRAGIDVKLIRRLERHPFAFFALGGPGRMHSTSRWTYVPTGVSQRIKSKQTALHIGGGIELKVHPRWVLRLDLTDFATFSTGSRDRPGKWQHRPEMTLGTMFGF
jgi:opacity protein-like surface antigen